jgi:hypothetical protein
MAAKGNGGVEKAVMPRPCLLKPGQRRRNGQTIRRVRFDESANTTHRFADVVNPQGKLGVQGADSDHLQDRAGYDPVRRTYSDREAMDGGASGPQAKALVDSGLSSNVAHRKHLDGVTHVYKETPLDLAQARDSAKSKPKKKGSSPSDDGDSSGSDAGSSLSGRGGQCRQCISRAFATCYETQAHPGRAAQIPLASRP